jgi:hypothetical protein
VLAMPMASSIALRSSEVCGLKVIVCYSQWKDVRDARRYIHEKHPGEPQLPGNSVYRRNQASSA